ncbi:YcaO-like family protein [Bacillus sp. JCM 19041]|uniref:YcaO-like family protein n=1 Tax=Bacillus sp. JCM 19041 TaxID=1460637 RepID=UPI0006D29398
MATAHELGDSAIDLDTIPRVSKNELEHPNCIARLPDKSKPIRWVMGVCLTTNKKVWIPAVMCYLYIPYKTQAEQFWAAISTGCATHSSYEQAIINGACEVLERDAIALTWLQKLELPKINLDSEENELNKYTDRQNQYIKNYFFDATNEIGIPTIYSVQKSIHNKDFSNLVMCSTELNPLTACKKLFRESASSRIPIQHKLENEAVSINLDSFHTVFDGALYMASNKRDSAYDFLLNSKNKKNLSDINNIENDSDASENLKLIINKLKEKGHDLFVVDLTTDEAKRYGLKVVKVIIPTMMPLSFHYRTQFLGTPRLYDYPKLIGKKPRMNMN